MPGIFAAIDRVKPFFDLVHKIVLFMCKMLLIADIVITCVVVVGRYAPFFRSPSWGEEVILSCMSYMAVLSAAIAIRKGAHIRMTVLDPYLNKKVVRSLDVLADVCVLILGVIMLVIGWRYASTIGSRGTYISMPTVSRFWMYFPIPLAGVAMIIFQIEVLFDHLKAFFVEEVAQ